MNEQVEWVMVPREPTVEMVDAAAKVRFDRLKSLGNGEREPLRGIVGSIEDDWRAMLAAAPLHETNLTPRQLAEQRKELVEALEVAAQWMRGDKWRASPIAVERRAWKDSISQIDDALAHARGEKQP